MATKSRIFRVSEITQDIKIILENTYAKIWIEGEVTNFQLNNGHMYFKLKDEFSQIKCVFFKGNNQKINFQIENGLAVVACGKISVYPKSGEYQLYIDNVEPKGLGALQLAFEQLKERLEKEGFFKQEHKKEIPFLPLSIGLVTSPTGAAIKDMIKILRRRAPFVRIIISPVKVQGEGSAEEIALAIKEFNEFNKVDVLIVARGGGSLEDLWAFNEEPVARAIYDSKIPVISAVGHEIDFTISDFVADVRAATPSEAAEIVAQKKDDIVKEIENFLTLGFKIIRDKIIQSQQEVDDLTQRAGFSFQTSFNSTRKNLLSISEKLRVLAPFNAVKQGQSTLNHLEERLKQRIGFCLTLNRQKFNLFVQKLEALSPLKVLSRGYSISFKDKDGEILKDISQVKKGLLVRTRLIDGNFISEVKEVN